MMMMMMMAMMWMEAVYLVNKSECECIRKDRVGVVYVIKKDAKSISLIPFHRAVVMNNSSPRYRDHSHSNELFLRILMGLAFEFMDLYYSFDFLCSFCGSWIK